MDSYKTTARQNVICRLRSRTVDGPCLNAEIIDNALAMLESILWPRNTSPRQSPQLIKNL